MQSNTYKIVIIGESNVGKTSILQRYINNTFSAQIERTVNSNCLNKTINLNNSNFVLNIWDTAGEEKYHALAPLFYRDADGAVLVFDLSKRESFNQISKWFREIREYSGEIKFILVGNKCDLPKEKIEVTSEEAKELAKEYNAEYVSASALDDLNIKEIFTQIAADIYNEKKEDIIMKKTKRKTIKLITEEEKGKRGCC